MRTRAWRRRMKRYGNIIHCHSCPKIYIKGLKQRLQHGLGGGGDRKVKRGYQRRRVKGQSTAYIWRREMGRRGQNERTVY